MYIRYSCQGNYQLYGRIRCLYTVMANPTYHAVHVRLARAEYVHTVYDRIFGDFPAKNTVLYTVYITICNSGQPYVHAMHACACSQQCGCSQAFAVNVSVCCGSLFLSSRCFSCYASQPMFFQLCTTADVFPVMHHSQCFFLLCITANVFPVMHHSRCVSRYASQPMCFLLCTTADVFPVMHHSQCLSCYASRFCFGQLESCRENPKKSRNLWQTHHTHTQLRDWYLVLRHLPGSGKGRMRLSLPS